MAVGPNGDERFNRTYGGVGDDRILGAVSEGDRVRLVGETFSFGATGGDGWSLVLTSNGTELANDTYSASKGDVFTDVVDGSRGLLVAGRRGVSDGEDGWLLEFVPEGREGSAASGSDGSEQEGQTSAGGNGGYGGSGGGAGSDGDRTVDTDSPTTSAESTPNRTTTRTDSDDATESTVTNRSVATSTAERTSGDGSPDGGSPSREPGGFDPTTVGILVVVVGVAGVSAYYLLRP